MWALRQVWMVGCLAGCLMTRQELVDASVPIDASGGPDALDAAPPMIDARPPPPPDPVEVPIVTPVVNCTEIVAANESAGAFNARLTIAGRTICIANGVTISGLVQVGASNITIASPAAGAIGKVLNAAGDAISIDGRTGIKLVRLDIESRAGSFSAAIRVRNGSVLATETTARCEGGNCYVLHVVDGAAATVARSTLLGGLATQTAGTTAAYGWNGATVEIADSTVRANGAALWDTVFSRFTVRRCVLQSANAFTAIVVYNSGARLLLQDSTVLTDSSALSAGGAASGVTVKLDGNTFRRVAGTPAGAESPIDSERADDVFHSTAPNTFCNEGTTTTDGAFGAPLVAGSYASASTFGSITQVGPIDCQD